MGKTERGNILFLLLLAVILFAALTYAVTQSLRGGGRDASEEQAAAMASQLVNYGTLVENTLNRMRIGGKYPEWGHDFDDDTGPSNAGANATCTETGCRLFTTSAREGQINSIKFDEKFVDPRLRASNPTYGGGSGTDTKFILLQVDNVGTPSPDVVLQIQNIRPEICRAVNKLLWHEEIAPEESYGGFVYYTGTLTSMPSSTARIGDQSNFFKGKSIGCIGRESISPPSGGDYYHVIMAR